MELRSELQSTDFWISIAILRSATVKTLPGGVSAATKFLIRRMCLGTEAMGNAGLCIRDKQGHHVLVHLNFGRILADEDALTSIWHIKGASGLVPCGVM